jgi:hypothetical protein
VTVQLAAVPEHSPPVQPAKTEPGFAVAERLTAVPSAKLAVQAAPQLIPAGVLVTTPLPGPARVTARLRVTLSNRAVTD